MVAIVAGQGLGLLNTSLGLLGSSGQLGVAGQGRSGEGVYVNATTGNLVVQQQDEWLVGLGPDAGISRTYNSLGTGVDDNGDNWRLGLSRQIIAGTGSWGAVGSTMVRVGEDGSQVSYTYNGTTYVSKSGGGSFDTLSWDSANNRWIWQDGDTQVKEYYEVTNATTKAARLKQVSDPDNKRLTLTYTGDLLTRVATSNGDYIDIEYETGTAAGNGQSKSRNIKSLTTTYASGTGQASIKRVSYTYDDYNRLSRVTVDLTPADKSITDGATYWTEYTYVDTSSRLIKTIKQSDDSLLSFTYESGKVKTITDVRGSDTTRVTTVTYGSGATAGTVDITDALGQITTLTYEQTGDETKQGQLLSIKSPAAGGKVLEQVFTYDSNGNVATVKDALGNVTVYQYDGNGNRTYERDAQNNVVARTYSTTNQLLTQTSYIDRDPDGAGSGVPTQALTTRYVYETATGKTHQLRYVITAQGYVTQYVYNDNVNGNGQLSKTVQYSADAYDLSGLTTSQVPTLAQMSTWSGTKAATGLPVVYSYNALGQLDTQTTYASVNASGEGLTDGTQSVTQFVYDQVGNLLKKIDGSQKVTEYLYDGLNRITGVKDAASGQWTTTSYLDGSRQTQVTMLNGLVVTSTYDQGGRLLTVARADGGTALGTTTYTYDKLGQLTLVTQPTGEKTYYLYDAASRKVGQIDGEGALIEFVYDAKGQVMRTLRYATKVSSTMLALVSTGLAGMPVNLLPSSSSASWSYAPSGAATGLSNGLSSGAAGQGTVGEQARWIEQAAGSTAGASALSSPLTQVAPGRRYEFSVYATVTNATATLTVEYYNASGTLLGISSALDAVTGTSAPTDKRLQGFLTIPTSPAGIAQIKLVVSKSGSTSTAQTSRLEILRPIVTQVTASQSQVSITDLRPPAAAVNDQSQWNVYDVAGRLVKTITSVYEYPVPQYRGAVVEYRYDGAGRPTDTIAYATLLNTTQMASVAAKGAVLTAGNGTLTVSNASTGTTVTTAITLTQDAANDRRVRSFYDADGRLTGQLDAENYYSENQYDKAGRLVRSTRYAVAMQGTLADGEAAPDVVSSPSSTTRAYVMVRGSSLILGGADQHTYYIYNARGQVKAVVDAEGFVTAYEYDAAGNKTREARYASAASGTMSSGAILLGLVYTRASATGLSRYVVPDATKDHVSTYEYDDNNRLKRSVSQPTGLETLYAYDVQGNLLKRTTALGQAEERSANTRYDKLGRVTAELGGEGSKALAALAANATTQQIEDVWSKYATRYQYDASGHRIATITPDGSGTTGNKTVYYYDQAGHVTHSINALGEVSTYVHDAFGAVTEQRRIAKRLANPSSYSGGLKTTALVDAVSALLDNGKDSTVTNAYDRAGLLFKRTDALGAVSQYNYNAFGEVRESYTPNATDVFGLHATYTYDRRGLARTVTKDNDEGVVYSTVGTQYDAFGRLRIYTDALGNETEHQYDKLGREIFLYSAGTEMMRYKATTYDAFGRVLTLTDPQGNQSIYSYNDVERSMTITLGGVSTTTRQDRLGQTVEVVDGRGNRTKYTYNADGQLTSTGGYTSTNTLMQGTTTSTQYDAAGRVSRTTNEYGSGTKVVYDAASRVITRIVDEGAGANNLTSQYLYDALGNAVWSRDAAGVWTQTAYDQKGRVTSVTVDPASIPGTDSGVGTSGIAGVNLVANPSASPLKQVTTFTYNADDTVLRVTRGAGSARPEVTAYEYDGLGRRTKEALDPDGLNQYKRYAYDAASNMVARTDALGNITRYVYNADGQVTYVIDATGAVVKTDYDANGRVTRTVAYADRISAANLAGMALAITWLDVQTKLPTTASNNSANQISYEVYDARGQLAWSIDALGYATQREYDAAGNVARVTRHAVKPTAFSTTGTLVDDRLSFAAPTWSTADQQLEAGKNQVDQYVYDGANRQSWHIDALGYATRTLYDLSGQRIRQTRYATPIQYPAGQTQLAIDTAPSSSATSGLPYYVIDADKDQLTTTFLDVLGRTAAVYDAMGHLSERSYDAAGRLQTVTRFTAEASGEYNPQDPGNATTTYGYDAAGNMTTVTDAAGVITFNQYDKAGRLTDSTQAYGTGDAATTHYVLDAAGRVTEEVRACGKAEQASTRYVLDALGRRTSIIDPRGIELAEGASTWAQNERQRLMGTTAAPVAGSDNYKTLLAQYTTQQEFDKIGRLTKSTDALGSITRTEYDAFGNAVKVTAPNNSVGYFYFDNNNQATWHVDPLNHATRTEYDAFGSVTKVTRFVAEVQNTQLLGTGVPPVVDPTNASTAGLYVTTTTGKDAITQIAHDLLGRQTTITDAENKSETIAYDAFGNKKSFTNKLGGAYNYTYDKVGNLLTETLPVKVKQYNTDGTLKTQVVNGATTTDWDVVNEYTYDSRGNRLTSKEGKGLQEERNTTYTYDLLDRLKTTTGEPMSIFTAADGTQSNKSPVETRNYDKRGNLIEVIDPNGARTLTFWDALNRKTAELKATAKSGTTQTGTLTQYDYNSGGDLIEQRIYGNAVTLPASAGGSRPTVDSPVDVRITRYAYDANHLLLKTTVPGVMVGEVNPVTGNYEIRTQDLVSQRSYDANGNLIKETDARGNVTWHYYDKLGNHVMQVDAERYVRYWTYDASGNVDTQKAYAAKLPDYVVVNADTSVSSVVTLLAGDADVRTTSYVRDRLGRVRIQRQQLGTGDAYTVNASTGQLTAANSLAETLFEYNALGSVTKKTEATGETQLWAYDQIGRETRRQGAAFADYTSTATQTNLVRQTTDTEYNALNQTARSVERAAVAHDGLAQGVSSDDAQDRITLYSHGKNGLLASETDAVGVKTLYEYDLAGNITQTRRTRTVTTGGASPATSSTTDLTTFSYDLAARQTKQASYNLAGATATWVNGTNYTAIQTQETRYDAFGQITGKRTYANAARSTDTWQEFVEFDSAGRVTKTNSGDGVAKAYVYDANGNATLKLTSAGANIQTTAISQLIGAADVYHTAVTYDRRGQVAQTLEALTGGARDSSGVVKLASSTLGAEGLRISFGGTASSTSTSSTLISGTVAAYKSQAVLLTYVATYSGNSANSPNDVFAELTFHIPDDARYGADAITKITIDHSSVSRVYYFDAGVRDTYTIGKPTGGSDGVYYIGDDDFPESYSTFQVKVEKVGSLGAYLIGSSTWEDCAADYNTWKMIDTPTVSNLDNAPPLAYVFNGQPTDATRLLLQYKKKSDANAPWAQISVPRRMVNGQPVPGSFVADQWANVLRDEYDIRYVALDAQGNVLNSQFGTMVLSDSAPSITQTTPPAGAGHAFLDSNGFINLTELGKTAQTAQIKFREVGTTNWITANSLSAAALADGVVTPGWFKFKPTSLSPTPLVAGKNYEFIVTTLDGSSAQAGKVKGSFIVGSGSSVSATLTNYTDLPQTVHFQNLPQNAASVRVLYRTTNTTGAWTPQDLKQASPGSFDWDTFDTIVNNPSNVYPLDYELQAFDAFGQLLYKSTGKVKVGTTNELVANSTVNTTPATGSLVFKPLVPSGSAPATFKLYYRPAGSTLAYTASASLTVTDGLVSFDASSLLPGAGSSGEWDYYYEVFNTGSTKLSTTGQPTALTPARLSLNPASRPAAQTVLMGVASPAQVAHTSQKVNAFGEIVEQTDALGRVTTLVYNKQGKLIEKIDPATDIVEETGTLRSSDRRPHTYYHYDLQGRLVGTTDANDYRTTYQLRPAAEGETIVAKEFHLGKTVSATRTLDSVKSQAYDRFGDLRYVNSELSANEFDTTYRTSYQYDKSHRVTQVTRPKRADQTYAGYDAYAYDEAGNRVKHWASTNGSTTASTIITNYTTFDVLGRVVQTDSGANRRVTYGYAYDATIKGVNGSEVGGWKVTTTTQNSTNNNVMVDYNDIFGRQSRHIDYGKHDFTYTYNAAGWLMNQSGTTGQSISYAYYADGRIKSITDDKLLTYTLYEYDRVGNKTFEGYATKVGSNWNFLQQATIAYDELNRIKSVVDPQYRIEYQYDAVGNRRHLKAFKLGASTPTQDYWYTYDGMNRFLVTMGKLTGGVITQEGSTDGIKITYDKTGQRIQALMASGNKREDYEYTVDGFLKTSYSSSSWSTKGGAISTRVSDVMGRVSQYINHLDATGTRTFYYNGDNQVTSEISNGITTTYNYDNDGTLLNSWYTETSGTKRTTHYEYEWWDDAKQSKILLQTNNGPKGWKTGTSNFIYDINGHVKEVRDYGSDASANTPDDRSLRYTTNAQGLILVRDEIANESVNRTQRFFYFDGARIGEVGNDGGTQRVDYAQALAQKPVDRKTAYKNWRPIDTADFDQNYEAIGPTYPGFTSAGYTARGNETLSQVAMAVWGDSSLWYLLADANGLTTDTPLVKDQILVIPNKVTNVHNNSSTRKVYNAGEAMGDTSPTLPDPPPPPQKKGGCGGIGQILMIVVAVVATALTAGALAPTLGPILAGAIGGAVGSIASQAVGLATGTISSFSWSGVAMGAIGGAVSGGLQGVNFGISNELGATMARAMVGNAVTQGVTVASGLQQKFDWKGVAAAGAGSAASYGFNAALSYSGADFGSDFGNRVGYGTLGGIASGVVQAAVFNQRPNWSAIAINSFGSALGDAVVGSIVQAEREKQQRDQMYGLASGDGKGGLKLGRSSGGNGLQMTGSAAMAFSSDVDAAIADSASKLPTYTGGDDWDAYVKGNRASSRQAVVDKVIDQTADSLAQKAVDRARIRDEQAALASTRRAAVRASSPNDPATRDGSITVGDLAELNAAFDRRDAALAARSKFVGPLPSYSGRGEIKATPYDWKTDSVVGKMTAGVFGDLYGATIGKLTRDDNLSVNPFTGRILSGREEFDARLGGVLMLAPGPKGVSGLKGLGGDVRGLLARSDDVALDMFGRNISPRTQSILDKFSDARRVLLEDGSGKQSVVQIVEGLGRREVKVSDLGRLQAATGNEFSLLRGPNGQRVLLQGDPTQLMIPEQYVGNGWKWSGHSHPYGVEASSSDRFVLRAFGQEQSVIKSAADGRQSVFTQFEDWSDWKPTAVIR